MCRNSKFESHCKCNVALRNTRQTAAAQGVLLTLRSVTQRAHWRVCPLTFALEVVCVGYVKINLCKTKECTCLNVLMAALLECECCIDLLSKFSRSFRTSYFALLHSFHCPVRCRQWKLNEASRTPLPQITPECWRGVLEKHKERCPCA